MPKTDDEKIIDALKRESFSELEAMRNFLHVTYEVLAADDAQNEEEITKARDRLRFVVQAFSSKYQDVVDKALRPPREGVVF